LKRKRPTPVKKSRTTKAEQMVKHVPTDEELRDHLQKTKWGQTALTDFLDRAEKNTKISYVKLKGYFQMFESLGNLFKAAVESVAYSDESGFAIALLLGRACGSYFASVRLSSSGQLAECYVQLRACLENALYAFNIHDDLTLAQVWFERHKNEATRKKSVNLFRPSCILDKLKQKNSFLGRGVGKNYDRCIDFGAHPNERSVTSNLKVSNDKINLDLLNTEKGVFHGCLLACVMCGLDVVRIFNLVYPGEFKGINAEERIRNIQEKFNRIAPGPIYDLRNITA